MSPREFEASLNLTPSEAAALLGINYARWMELRRGSRKVKPYHVASMEAHCLLSKRALALRLKS